MNQILDRTGPRKSRIQRDPKDTIKIVKVYAILMIIFGIVLVTKGSYAIYENKKMSEPSNYVRILTAPEITLEANQDILNIKVKYSEPIELISYQWYRGIATQEEIEAYEENPENFDIPTDEADDELQEEVKEIYTIGELVEEKLTGENEGAIYNIGIPKGDTTIVVVATANNGKAKSTFIQSYHTDIGVDKIAPTIDVKLKTNGTTLIVTAKDETEISKLIYSVNGVAGPEVIEREDKETIKIEIELDPVLSNSVKISAVDKANNTSIPFDKEIDIFTGEPTIEWGAEPDYSKVYANISYYKGIQKIEYTANGSSDVLEFDNPRDLTSYELEFDCAPGYNEFTVKVYSTDEKVVKEDSGNCEYGG